MQHNHLFEEFPPLTKAEWLAQITKDLKGRPLEALEWTSPGGFPVSPLVHAEDQAYPPTPLLSSAQGWEIGEEIQVADFSKANQEAMEALRNGAEGIRFVLDDTPDVATLEVLLTGIHLDFIGLHFRGERLSPAALLGVLHQIARQKNIPTHLLRGSIEFNPFSGPLPDWRYVSELVEFAAREFPQFQVITLTLPIDADLSQVLLQANNCLKALSERGVSADTAQRFITIAVPTGSRYFWEIAKLRALKVLWINLLNAWGAPKNYPVMEATVAQELYSDDLYTNMIRSTTMAMSAVLGGANRLFIPPYDAGREAAATYPPAFGRRIARNVQHLLKMESHLDDLVDPAAGSYYLENLSNMLAEKAWMAFTEASK